jgi:hypothetical protein
VEYDLDMTYYNYPSGPLSGKPPCVGESEGVFPQPQTMTCTHTVGMLYNTEC